MGNDTPGQTLIGGSGDDTFYARHSSVVITGAGGADTIVFEYVPWSAGHVTDFTVGTDKIDMSALFAASGYAGSNPVGDGYLRFQSDGGSGTRVLYDPDGSASGNPWPFLITTLDHVSPVGLTAGAVLTSGGGQPPSPPPPPPPPPPTGGQTFTGTDSPGQTLTGGSGDDTFYAGHSSVVMTGNGGADKFIFQYLPWSAGHITDFTPGTDKLDLHALFAASGYTGTNPVADGYLQFQSDGQGGTKVLFDPDGPNSANPWPTLITTLDHVAPSSMHSGDWFF
jgi:Ca2+-binding RTX toxin-like protein